MDRSAVILAGGISSRLGQDKGLITLENRPLIKHVLAAVKGIVDEKFVVVSSKIQSERYSRMLDKDVTVLVDLKNERGPLVGAATGLERVSSKYSILLPCDTPLVSRDILSLLSELCIGKTAVIPRWPNCYIEPLQAVYCSEPALQAAKKALMMGKFNMQAMVDKLRGVRYVSTLVLRQLDPELRTFFNINTVMDLRKAEAILNKDKKQ